VNGPGNRRQHRGAAGTSTKGSHDAAIVVVVAENRMRTAFASVTARDLTVSPVALVC